MKKLFLTFLMTLFTLAGACLAEAASFEAQGIKLDLPQGFTQTAPRMGYLMEATAPRGSIAEVNLSTAPEDDYTPTEADLQRYADNYFERYSRRGNTMLSKAVVDVVGGHRGICLIGEKQVGQQKLQLQWLLVVMHNKRYMLLYTYQPEFAAAVEASRKSFACTANH